MKTAESGKIQELGRISRYGVFLVNIINEEEEFKEKDCKRPVTVPRQNEK